MKKKEFWTVCCFKFGMLLISKHLGLAKARMAARKGNAKSGAKHRVASVTWYK